MTELCAWNYGSTNDGEIKKTSSRRPEAQRLADARTQFWKDTVRNSSKDM